MKRSLAVTLVLVLALACNTPVPSQVAPPTATPTTTAPPTMARTPDPPDPDTPTPDPYGGTLLPGVDISAFGSDAFLAQTEEALRFLQGCAPDALAFADEYVSSIVESGRSGMMVNQGTFLASETTAFAPGYSAPAQVFWYGGTLVHDARHRWQSQSGTPTDWDNLTLEQREAIEADARAVQIDALEKCLDDLPEDAQAEGQYLIQYLVDMQDGVIPCDYCEVEWADRDW